jgi:hypothetical protein
MVDLEVTHGRCAKSQCASVITGAEDHDLLEPLGDCAQHRGVEELRANHERGQEVRTFGLFLPGAGSQIGGECRREAPLHVGISVRRRGPLERRPRERDAGSRDRRLLTHDSYDS